jgi:hypothetical protein
MVVIACGVLGMASGILVASAVLSHVRMFHAFIESGRYGDCVGAASLFRAAPGGTLGLVFGAILIRRPRSSVEVESS